MGDLLCSKCLLVWLAARCSLYYNNSGENSGTAKGFVTHIIYRNNGNGYTVFELNTGDEITCVGTF